MWGVVVALNVVPCGFGNLRFSVLLTPPLPCRASPPQVGRSTRGGPSAISNLEIEVGVRALLISLLVGEMPGRAEGGEPNGTTLPFCTPHTKKTEPRGPVSPIISTSSARRLKKRFTVLIIRFSRRFRFQRTSMRFPELRFQERPNRELSFRRSKERSSCGSCLRQRWPGLLRP